MLAILLAVISASMLGAHVYDLYLTHKSGARRK